MDWKERYQSRICTADEAVKQIKSGDRVVFQHAAGEPPLLTDAMARNYRQYRDVEIVHMGSGGKALYCPPEMQGHFIHNSMFVSPQTQVCIAEGRGDYTPAYFCEVPRLFRTSFHPNVALLNVSRPDENGYCSLGVSVDYTKALFECADLRIVQVNKYMPRTFGDSYVHADDFDVIVEQDVPVMEMPPAVPGELDRQIARHCAALVRDGDTLQVGVGSLPDSILLSLMDKNDLGIHTEMMSDRVMELMQKGIITNRAKEINRGKSVASFLMGTREFYEYVDLNPAVMMMPVDYVNDPAVIARHDNMVSINSCVQVDLMGQVVSSSIGLTQISSVGGQVDFVRGSNMAKNGRSIIAMPSTASKGKVSRIVPFLAQGAAVTTNRYDVNYIVTEFGSAYLKGKTLRNRARALIEIAHPDFRDALRDEFRSRFRESC